MHKYDMPIVTLLTASPLEIVELASRMPMQNMAKDPDVYVRTLGRSPSNFDYSEDTLAKTLVHVRHHNSIAEHSQLSFLVQTSRGVLQELARHRIGVSMTVQSTRYSISLIVWAFMSTLHIVNNSYAKSFFIDKMLKQDVFNMNKTLNAAQLFESLTQLYLSDTERFMEHCYSKGAIEEFNKTETSSEELYDRLKDTKTKKIAGDYIKHLVNDSWKTNVTITFNLRSLESFLKLRDSGAAWYQMQDLAKALIDATPVNHMQLVYKNFEREDE